MIDMAVGDQDLFDRDTGLRRRRLQLRQIAARIDERGLVGLGAPEECAILLQRRDGHDRGLERGCGHGRGCGVQCGVRQVSTSPLTA